MHLWYTRCPLPTASSVAIDGGLLQGAFDPDGITVRSLNASSDRGVREAHFDHGQSNLFRQGGNIPPLWSRSRGADTVVVAATWIDEYQAVIALPDSGLRGPGDLRGRRLGVPRRVNDPVDYWRAMCLRGFHAAVKQAGLTNDDVVFVDLPIDERQIPDGGVSAHGSLWRGAHRARRQSRESHALLRGEVDAIYTAGAPGAQLTAYLDARVVVDLAAASDPRLRVNNQVPCILTVDGALARERPEIVARYLAALQRGAEWARTHRSETYAIVGDDVGATREWVEAAYGPRLHEQLGLYLGVEALAGLEAQKAFLLAHGFIERDFPFDSWVDRRPLDMMQGVALERGAR